MKPTVALVGRPNVGKSTLFNRLSHYSKAIVHDSPGVTRDRKYGPGRLGHLEFIVIDTPGLEQTEKAAIEERMMGQTFAAIASADLVCVIVDGPCGITPQDEFFASLIRRNHKNIVLVANKCEKKIVIDKQFFRLGFGEPVCISAEHGMGMMELCEIFAEKLPSSNYEITDPFKSDQIQIAVIGRPNAGKSTFINALLNEQRLLTGPEAGITRDSVDIDWYYKGKNIKLVDTAGMRKRTQIHKQLEKISVADSLGSIKYANIIVLMVDANLGIESQDLNLLNYVIQEGRAVVLAINKWDVITDKKSYKEEIEYKLSTDLSYLPGIEVVYISSINKDNVQKVIDSAIKSYEIWNTKIPTAKLNKWLEYALEHHPLPLLKNGRRARLKYGLQLKSRPPTFKFFANNTDALTESYKKYLSNSMRKEFGLWGVPIRMHLAKSENPYAKKKK
ncbi:MAG: ribosome biogenesis GTPase Der [Alphaproteobacteria bacterium]|nr:ribosome biogenesis GTPase Der [Alphaproteobacteria bacterium]